MRLGDRANQPNVTQYLDPLLRSPAFAPVRESGSLCAPASTRSAQMRERLVIARDITSKERVEYARRWNAIVGL
ncbi:hypothetical protein [Streptomyces canus]|uniref:hypothetical protein n=1 Tax=Streptomyces canus TaxID=58343 RepID=UPI00386EBDCB